MSSTKKVKANRANARSSSGPKTANGKKNSSRNALKHGLFAKELLLSDVEKVEFQALRRALHAQLQPTTVLQSIGLEQIAWCAWRCKLAAREEMRQMSALSDTPDDREVQPEKPTERAMARWYLAGRKELNEGVRLLEDLARDFERAGRVSEEWKQPLDNAFGSWFYQILTAETLMSLDAIGLAIHFG